MKFSRYANTAEAAVDLEETAPPRERRPPMRHIVSMHLRFAVQRCYIKRADLFVTLSCQAPARENGKAKSYQFPLSL